MKEINKENDILVSTLLNPTADSADLIANGINGANTGFLSKDEYKRSKFVLSAFTTKDGVFDDTQFEKVYDLASSKFNELQSILTYDNLNGYAKYDINDIYAPIQSNKTELNYTIQKVKNPTHVSEGVTSLFGKSESDKSLRELALAHKVWDPENEKWLDYTAEDLGLKYLISPSLVYATWDEDGSHFDSSIGREVKHKKGEWKTDENGEFYTELAGNKQLYGKEYVALSDVLTKEDSWANKIDFFDSDDKDKSLGGQLMKTAATIVPYLIPGVREVWGGITAAVDMGTVLPAFGKMLEGIAVGDKETAFTKAMSAQENLFGKFTSSHSDEAQKSIINSETMLETIGDVFGLLYQMRAAASLSKLFQKSMTKAEKEASKKFSEKFGAEFAKARIASKDFANDTAKWEKLYTELLHATPEMKAIVDKTSKLSKSLSLGYMALTSSADVYSDALQGGYDRRMAGLAGLLATAGQYGLMMNNRMGDWFLDATVGYQEGVSRNAIRQALKPYYEQIAEASKKLGQVPSPNEKIGIISKLYNNIFKLGGKKLVDLIKYGGESIWQRATIEGVEEVTEEAVMDATKGIFDALSYFGIGKNSETASFGGWNNTFSAEGAQRYLMNFIGGAIGGAIFDVQGRYIEPRINALISGKAAPEVRYSIIDEVMKGHTQQLMEEAAKMAEADKTPVKLENGEMSQKTLGEMVRDALQNYIRFVDGIVTENNFKIDEIMSDDTIKKVIRTKALLPLMESSGIMDMITGDYTKMVDDYIKLQAEYNSKYNIGVEDKDNKEEDSKKSEKNKTTDKKEDESKENAQLYNSEKEQLEVLLKNKKQQIIDFLSGKNEVDYLKTALIYLHPLLRKAAMGVDKYIFTKGKYGIEYSSLPESGSGLSKEAIDSEYAEWKKSTDTLEKMREIGIEGFNLAEQQFSKVLKDYANLKYSDVRLKVFELILADSNFNLETFIKDPDIRGNLIELSKKLSDAKLPGINLEDKLKLGKEAKEKLINNLTNVNTLYFQKLAQLLNTELDKQKVDLTPEQLAQIQYYSEENLKSLFTKSLVQNLEKLPLLDFTKEMIDNALAVANSDLSKILIDNIIKSSPEEKNAELIKKLIDTELQTLGFTPIPNYEFTGDPLEAAVKYVTIITAPKYGQDLNDSFNIGYSILDTYIDSNDIIDNEIVNKIKKLFIDDVLKSFDSIRNVLTSGEFEPIYVDTIGDDIGLISKNENENQLKLQLFLREGINNDESLEEIIDKWLFSPDGIIDLESEGFLEFERRNPDIRQKAVKAVVDIIKSLPSYNLFDKATKKQNTKNPLFDALREIGMKVFDGDDVKLFDFLENESKILASANIGDYIRQGFTKEAIDNFISKLQFILALAVGMEESAIDPEHQIAFNVQMRLWDQKWNLSKNAEKYATIDTLSVISIQNDLDLLINKLEFIKTLIETNTESKIQENVKTELNFNNIILDTIDKIGLFAIGGVTILPSDDELNKCKTEKEKVALIEHTIYSKGLELLKQGYKLDSLINDIYSKFNINRETIHNENLPSQPLNSDTKFLTDYDIFIWLTTALSSDSYEFLFKYKDLLSLDSYKLVPFFTQEYAAKILYSFANDSYKIHDAAIKWLYQLPTLSSVLELSRIAFVNGIAGAGKTAAVMSTVKALLNEDNIICAAPNENQAAKLAASLQSVSDSETRYNGFSKRELLEQFVTEEGLKALDLALQDSQLKEATIAKIVDANESGTQKKIVANIDPTYIKQVNDAPKLLFIDEITHFNIAELALLDAAAKKNGFKIITAGDTLQKGNTVWNNSNILDVFAWKTPALTISSRAANIHLKDNINLLQGTLRYTEAISLVEGFSLTNEKVNQALDKQKRLTYYQTDSELQGSKIVTDFTVEDLKSIKKASNGKSLMIIADLDNNGEIEDSEFLSKLHDAEITNYDLYSPDDYSAKAVQGAEADYVIIKDMPFPGRDRLNNLRTFYTYLSRALEGALVREEGYSQDLNLICDKVPYTSRYELPGLSQLIKMKGEKLSEINNIIKDYIPEKKEQNTSTLTPVKVQMNTSITDNPNEPANSNDSELLLTVTEEAEKAMEKKPQPINTGEVQDFIEGIRSYTYYNRLGLNKNSMTITTGNHLDLDGLFGKNNQKVPNNIILGYKKLKNYLVTADTESIYNNDGKLSDSFKGVLYDSDIVDLLYAIYPNIAEGFDNSDDIRTAIIDAINNDELSFNFGDLYYIIVKNYDPNFDTSDSLTGVSSKEGSLIANFGKLLQILHNGAIVANQIVTLGSLGQMDTITAANLTLSNKIKCDGYAKLLADASNKLKTELVAIYEVDSPKIGRDLVIYQTENKLNFISMDDMINRQGIHFDSNEYGIPNVYLINNDKSTVKGIETFSFLHLIAKTEPSPLEYDKRIKQLEDSFVRNGKLTVSGYYFAIGSYGLNSPLLRVLILQPSGYSFKEALKRLLSILHSKNNAKEGSRLQQLAESMSQASQMRLFRSVFKALGAVDSNGLVISGTEGIKPYLEKIAADIAKSNTETKWLSDFPTWLQSEIDAWEGKDYDIDFLSYLMKGGTPNEEGKSSSYGRYIGPLLINDLISFNDNGTITAKELLQEGQERRNSVDIDFDLTQLSYREFLAAAEQVHDSFQLDDLNSYSPIKIKLDKDNLHFIGLYDTYLQPPYFYFNDESLGEAKPAIVDFTTSKWERKENIWSEAVVDDTKHIDKGKPVSTASIKEMRNSKTYNPKTDLNPILVIHYSKKGYMKDENGNTYNIDPKKNFYNIRTFTDKELLNWENKEYQVYASKNRLFNLRLYDTVLIFGDDTHTYKLSYAVTNNGHVIGYKFSHKDGNPVTSNDIIYVNEISSVVSRDVPDTPEYGWKNYVLLHDYYSHPNYEYARKNYRERQSGKAALIWNLNEGKEASSLLFNNPSIKNLLIYAVHESDDSVLSPVSEAAESLEEGVDLTNTGVHIASNPQQAIEIINNLSKESNLNGIAIIGVYGSGEGYVQFMLNRKAFLERIVNNGEGYIKAYLSDSNKPKFAQKTAKVQGSNYNSLPEISNIPRVKRKSEATSEKAQKVKALIEQASLINDFYDRITKLKEEFYDTFAEAKLDFPKDYLVFPHVINGETKYSVVPKSIIPEFKNVDFLNNWNEGDTIKIVFEDKNKNGESYAAKIIDISLDSTDPIVTYEYFMNENHVTKLIPLLELNMLKDIKYFKESKLEEKRIQPVLQRGLRYLPTEIIQDLRATGNITERQLKEYDLIYKEMTDYLDSMNQDYSEASSEDILYLLNGILKQKLDNPGLPIEDMFVIDENGDIDLKECK